MLIPLHAFGTKPIWACACTSADGTEYQARLSCSNRISDSEAGSHLLSVGQIAAQERGDSERGTFLSHDDRRCAVEVSDVPGQSRLLKQS